MDTILPCNVSKLRPFLGLLNYYRKFLPNLSTTLHPLNQLIQAGHHWNWDARCDSAFKLAKDTLYSAQVLVHYNTSSPLKLATDALAYGTGAVILHVLPAYTYDIEFKSTHDHANADCQSRLPLEIKDSVVYLAGIHLSNKCKWQLEMTHC